MNLRRLTIERTTIIILFGLIFALAARVPVDTDTWWHIRSGEHILQNGIIYADPFSYTFQGQPWIDHSWGSQLVLYGIWQIAGYFGLSVFMAALATAGMAVVFRMCDGNAYLRAFAVVLGAATAAVFWSPRPQMFSFFLSAVILYILWMYRARGIDRLWFIPPLMALWGNLHAGFSIGFIFMGAVIVGEVLTKLTSRDGHHLSWQGIRKLVIVALVSVAALVINPYGFQMLLVPFQTVSIGALQNFIQEWNSPNFHERQTWPFIALLVGVLGAAGASQRRMSWTDFLLVGGTAFMALLAGRNIAVFAVAATPVLTRHLNAALIERGWILKPLQVTTPRMARLNAILVAVVMLGCLAKVLVVLDDSVVQPAVEQYLPSRAANYISENPVPPNMFNSYNWGGYLMFALPETPVFVDGRTDLYGDTFLTESYYQTAIAEDGWQDTLRDYGVNTVVVETNSGLGRVVSDSPDWRVAYTDEQAVVAVRVDPIPAVVGDAD